MNVVFLLCDTLTRDKLAPYHGGQGRYGHIRTPNLDRLARRATTFTNHWIASAPCMPARRDLWSGRIEFPWRSWGPQESFDPDWARTLRNETAVTTCLVTDHANLFDVGSGNYHHHFDTWLFTRGHFNDHDTTPGRCSPGRAGQARQLYLESTRGMEREEQTFVARNLSTAARWLDDHHAKSKPFFLCIDEFDPHWPLDPPEPYRSMYLTGRETPPDPAIFFRDTRASDHTPEELAWLEAQYAGKVTLVDRWIGELLDRFDRHQLWDDTLFILTTDHGEFIGEYRQISKGGGPSYPLFARIPLFMHLPGGAVAGQRCDALTSTVDLHATVLEALGASVSPHTHSHSLLPLVRGKAKHARQDLIYGWWGKGFYWTDGRHLLCKAPVAPGPLYQYGTDFGEKHVGLAREPFDRYAAAETDRFLPHTDRPVYRVPSDGMAYGAPEADVDLLFDLTRDPDCRENRFHTDAVLREQCLARLRAAMRTLAVPAEHFERLGVAL